MIEQAQVPIRVLFLCTGNSARSQMAEAWLRELGGRHFEAHSAGTHPAPRINPLTERVMGGVSVSLAGQYPKTLDDIGALDRVWDYVITTCDQANETCPVFPGDTERIHWGFEDPAAVEGTEEQRLRVFRRVRDEIKRRVQLFIALKAHQRAGVRA
jgi:arsenate reductase